LQRLLPRARLARDAQIRLPREHLAQAVAHDRMIVHDQNGRFRPHDSSVVAILGAGKGRSVTHIWRALTLSSLVGRLSSHPVSWRDEGTCIARSAAGCFAGSAVAVPSTAPGWRPATTR